MNQEKITKFITELRKEKKLTQQEFADVLGVTNSAVSKWESGKCLPDPTLYSTIADYFGISISELLAGKRENKKRKLNILLWLIILLIVFNLVTLVEYYKLSSDTIVVNKLKVSNDNLILNGFLLYNKKESYVMINNLSIPAIEAGTNNSIINNLVIYLKSGDHTVMKIEKDIKESKNTLSPESNFFKIEHLNPKDLTIEYSYFNGIEEVQNKSKINIINIHNNQL